MRLLDLAPRGIVLTESWRKEYYQVRPHSPFRYWPPDTEIIQLIFIAALPLVTIQ